jgi:hypothetical protein
MPDNYSAAQEALARLEEAQRAQYRPAPKEPVTPVQAYAERLGAARSETISIDAGWLR